MSNRISSNLCRALPWIAASAIVLACGVRAFAAPPEGKEETAARKVVTVSTNSSTDVTTTEPIPATLDQAIADAMENYPEIVTAKAKLKLAEAELNGKRMEAAGKVIDLWGECRKQAELVNLARTQFGRVEELHKIGGAGGEDAAYDAARKNLIEAEAKQSQMESELRYLIRKAGPSVNQSCNSDVAKPVQVPKGPMVENVRRALSAPTALESIVDMPISDVCEYMKSLHGIEIQLDTVALGEAGIDTEDNKPTTFKLTLNITRVSLGAALQAIDDKFPKLKFVLRDYGILVTSPERARQQGYMPVVDFWASDTAARDSAVFEAPKKPRPPKTPMKPVPPPR